MNYLTNFLALFFCLIKLSLKVVKNFSKNERKKAQLKLLFILFTGKFLQFFDDQTKIIFY